LKVGLHVGGAVGLVNGCCEAFEVAGGHKVVYCGEMVARVCGVVGCQDQGG
jgi:hypothetical protein